MMNLINSVKKKVNGIIISLVFTGVLLVFLGVVITVNDLIFRILVAFFVFIVAYTFLHGAYRIWSLKKELEKYFEKY